MRITTAATLGVALGLLGACGNHDHGHDHADEHPEGHDHHADDHGHHDGPVVKITAWSDELELFAEHPPAVAGQPVTMLAHLTVLDDFSPLAEGTLRLELEGPGAIGPSTSEPVRPGIFNVTVTLSAAGRYEGRLVVDGPTPGAIEGLRIQVHASAAEAAGAGADEDDEGLIELLKEQQWNIPFATAFAEAGTLVESIQVAGTVETPPGGSAEVGAAVAGRLVAPSAGLPRPGAVVKKGQLLASLVPAPASPEGAARATLAVTEAEARAAAARIALERAERLIRDQAISQRELEDARREVGVAEETVRSARQAAALYSGASGGGSAGSWRLVAPIAGVLTAVDARPGAQVSPGEVLFRIVDDGEMWIRARVPEQEAARLRTDHDARYQVAGLDTWKPIRITGETATASVVTVGRTVDPTSRTVDVIYALSDPDPALRVGGLVQVSLPAGEEITGVVVPTAAVLHDEGREIVYVQVDGEHFEERGVLTGARSGDRVALRRGVEAGERVVTRGAHLVRLTGSAGSGDAHGHIH
jgi:membrane fusion protein, heavy metal efflux system